MSRTQADSGRPSLGLALLILGIALNLRPFLAAPGPILPAIVEDTGLGYGALSLLTLLPMLLMGIGAFGAPVVLSRLGTRGGMLLALGLLFLGSSLRLVGTNGSFLILTSLVCGAGAACVQSAVPGLIKEKFTANVAGMTGLYSAMIMIGGAFGAQTVPFLITPLGLPWTTALALLSAPVLIALIAAVDILPDSRAVRQTPGVVTALMRRQRCWILMAVFGLINGGYASLIAWLAPYYQAQGLSSSDSAFLISVLAICQGIGAVGLPLLARQNLDRRPWLWLCIALQMAGFSGLTTVPLWHPVLWVALCGVGLAGSFALCLIVALDHLPDPSRAGTLASLTQGGGFVLAAIPPFLLALIKTGSGSFAGGWIMHLVWLGIAAILVCCFNPKLYAQAKGDRPAVDSLELMTGSRPRV